MLTLPVSSSTESRSASHAASRKKASPEQCTYSNSNNTSSQVQQSSKHHDKEIQPDEGRWSEVTQKAWKNRAEYTKENRRVYLTCLEMVSAHYPLLFNKDTVKNNISGVVCGGRIWRWRFHIPPIRFPRRHSLVFLFLLLLQHWKSFSLAWNLISKVAIH